MKNLFSSVIACLSLSFAFSLQMFTYGLSIAYASAEEIAVSLKEIVVTASKIEEAVEQTTSSVIVITSDEIKKMNVQFVTDVLRKIPELNLVQSGGPGKLATVLLRGGGSTHTLVMIDGVKVKSTTTGSFDFSGITVDDIERIEIVKGPQSTIYGSEAMAGVINIITKKGKGKPKIDASFEGGSYGTYKSSATISGGAKKIDYRLTGTYFYTDGISAAKAGTERDGYKNASVSGKFGFRPTEKVELEISGRYYSGRSELDAFGRDDLNYVQHGNHHMLSGKAKFYLFNNWEQILTVSQVADSLKYRDPDTAFHNSDIITGMNTYDWQHNLYLSDIYTLTGGVEYRKEHGENRDISNNRVMFDKSIENRAYYLNNKLTIFNEALALNAGLRHDDHETFGSETTYRIGAVYNIKPAAMRIRSSYGTGFRAPTLNELFYNDPWGSRGNLNLKPEKSKSWEIGIEKDIVKEKASVSIIYFEQTYNDLIQWIETPPGSWTWTPQNIAKAEVKGIETGARLRLTDNLSINAGYTYLDTEDKATGKRLQRRPKDKVNLLVDFVSKDFSINANYTYVGERYDDAANRRKLSSYSLVNLSGSYKIGKGVTAFARMENLLDKDYEEARGFGRPGFSAFGGIRVSF